MSRLKSLYVKDFRSIDGEVNISLDAPIVLIHGPNGAGKTSLLSAIELALTGAVPSLSRAEPDYLAYLPHKDRPFGEVRLEVEGRSHVGDIRVTTTGVTGTPVLGAAEASFFSERSYLAQSTLGRLLEIYQHAEKKSDSPLTRFVKELLGLDRMEAIIGGLNSAGHISRLKGPVPAYGAVRDDIVAKERELASIRQQETEMTSRVAAQEDQLRARLAAINPTLVEDIADLDALTRTLANDPEEAGLVQLVRERREVEVSEATWAQVNASPATADRTSIETANQLARTAFDNWTRSNGERIEAMLTRAGTLFAEVPVMSESGYIERARSLAARAQPDLERIQRVLSAHDQAVQRRADLSRQIEEGRTRIQRLDEQIAAAAEMNESLAKALSELSAHIDDDVCPVCDRDFSETGSTPLAAHVAAKVSAMVEHAGRLQSLSKDRSNTSAAVAQLERQVAAATTELLADPELNRLKSRAADLTEVARQLNDAMQIMQEGDRLRSEAARTARSSLVLQNADQSAVALRKSLEDVASRIGAQIGSDVPTGDLLQRVKSMILQREAALNERQRARRAAVEAVASLATAIRDRVSLQTQQREIEAVLTTMRGQKEAADKLIELARDLVKQTREARGRVVRRVFNDELNAVWRDLFEIGRAHV